MSSQGSRHIKANEVCTSHHPDGVKVYGKLVKWDDVPPRAGEDRLAHRKRVEAVAVEHGLKHLQTLERKKGCELTTRERVIGELTMPELPVTMALRQSEPREHDHARWISERAAELEARGRKSSARRLREVGKQHELQAAKKAQPTVSEMTEMQLTAELAEQLHDRASSDPETGMETMQKTWRALHAAKLLRSPEQASDWWSRLGDEAGNDPQLLKHVQAITDKAPGTE